MRIKTGMIFIGLLLSSILIFGCSSSFSTVSVGAVLGSGNRYHYDRYCFDCHYKPHWSRPYRYCGYYDIYFEYSGYRYAPRSVYGSRTYVFTSYKFKNDRKYYYKYPDRRYKAYKVREAKPFKNYKR